MIVREWMTHLMILLLIGLALLVFPVPVASGGIVATEKPASFADFDRRARAGESMNVVFFGGSLTWGAHSSDPQRTSYRALMAEFLRGKYPCASFTFHDAAIGGTGSHLGMFRLERDVLSRQPDLVFLDFTANDDLSGTSRSHLASYEILLREMIGQGIPVVQAFLGFKYNFGPHWNPENLHRVQDHKKLAMAYRTGVGDSFPLIQEAITTRRYALDEIWPLDGAHPVDVGYRLFFEAVRDGFEQAVAEGRVCVVPAEAVFSDQYTQRRRIRLIDLPVPPAGWKRSLTYRTSLWFDGLSSRWMDDVLVCGGQNADSIAPLRLTFEGTFVAVLGEADQEGLSFRATIDGKPVQFAGKGKITETIPFNTSDLGPGRLLVWRELATDLPPGKHLLEIHPIPNPNHPQAQLRLESICVAGPSR